jgi:hypothetical protein
MDTTGRGRGRQPQRGSGRGGRGRLASAQQAATAKTSSSSSGLPLNSSTDQGRGRGRGSESRAAGRARGRGRGNGSAKSNVGNQGTIEPPAWRYSEAKKKLAALLKDESSWVKDKSWDEIYFGDPDFQLYRRDLFKNNAKALKKKIEVDQAAVAFDRMSLSHDRKLYPPRAITERGEPRYEGSAIEDLLKKDVKEGKSAGTKPQVLWRSRPEYQQMSLDKFRVHKNRADQSLVETVFWQKKRNDKGRKDYEEAVAKMNE